MSPERLRASCRRAGPRGGRGRTSVPRSSDSLSDEANSARRRRGRRRGSAQARPGQHSTHPSSRFCFPVRLEADTFYVSVKIEKCSNEAPGSSAEIQPRSLPALPPDQPPTLPAPQPPDPVPDSTTDAKSSVPDSTTAANSSGEARAGPSAPVEDDAPHTDSSEPDPYSCRMAEEIPSTSVDD